MTLLENYVTLIQRALSAENADDLVASIAATNEMLAHFRASDPYGWISFIEGQATANDMLLLEERANEGESNE